MRTTINLSLIILALVAWAAARPTIQDYDKREPVTTGPFPSFSKQACLLWGLLIALTCRY